jgi:hypothetical protein
MYFAGQNTYSRLLRIVGGTETGNRATATSAFSALSGDGSEKPHLFEGFQHSLDHMGSGVKPFCQRDRRGRGAFLYLVQKLFKHGYKTNLAALKTTTAADTEMNNIKPIFTNVHFHEPVSWRITATVAAHGMKRMETVRNARAVAGE